MIYSTDIWPGVLLCILGLLLLLPIAVRAKLLSRSGALAAAVVGTLAVGAGWDFAIVLLGFFGSSSALSKYRSSTKRDRLSGIVAKASSRDAAQVFANGGVFSACALLWIETSHPAALFASIGSLAGAASDTWATEIGSLASAAPRSILSWKPVPAGTSGGVTMVGWAAAVAGALFIGLLALSLGMPAAILPACVVGGFAGSIADSLLGATLQCKRWCEQCRASTEQKVHSCGQATRHLSGFGWMDNDVVNFCCTLIAAGIAALWVL